MISHLSVDDMLGLVGWVHLVDAMSRCSGDPQIESSSGGETIDQLVDEDTFENRTGTHKFMKEEDPQSATPYQKPRQRRLVFGIGKSMKGKRRHRHGNATGDI
jgi:hypothetical protein